MGLHTFNGKKFRKSCNNSAKMNGTKLGPIAIMRFIFIYIGLSTVYVVNPYVFAIICRFVRMFKAYVR